MTNTDPQLPAEVLDAIHAGRKIEAIKYLRRKQGLDLLEAKQVVDDYMVKNAHMVGRQRAHSNAGAVIVVIIAVAAAYPTCPFVL